MSNQDLLYRYLFEEYEVRGELVQLDHTYRHVVEAQNYPVQVQKLLGELLVATSLLTATLKFEGSITVQLQGDGPVRLAVINGDNNDLGLNGVPGVPSLTSACRASSVPLGADSAKIHDAVDQSVVPFQPAFPYLNTPNPGSLNL